MLYPGRFLEPSEIGMLAHAFQTVCKERGVYPLSQEGERLASHLLKLFMNGLTGEDELLDAERNRARRHDRSLQQVSASHAGTREAA
ncbi:hypothetical protein FJ955_28455 [Mesorhizobium sp. B2-2-2]|nr:hypothetical protein FJ955_28455 [Mesorhizobium sp. B2-2-2]